MHPNIDEEGFNTETNLQVFSQIDLTRRFVRECTSQPNCAAGIFVTNDRAHSRNGSKKMMLI